jgi:phosphoribosyl-ATP pyrophosphohydrolase
MARPTDILAALDEVLAERRSADPDESYVASLYAAGLNRILEKVGEEATEVILAAKDNDGPGAAGEVAGATARASLVGEVADLWFHTLVMLNAQGISSSEVLACLDERFGLSGHEEKASRLSNA